MGTNEANSTKVRSKFCSVLVRQIKILHLVGTPDSKFRINTIPVCQGQSQSQILFCYAGSNRYLCGTFVTCLTLPTQSQCPFGAIRVTLWPLRYQLPQFAVAVEFRELSAGVCRLKSLSARRSHNRCTSSSTESSRFFH
jgi:hypothetical protein